MQDNITTTVERLLPGDTWTEIGNVYIIVAVEPIKPQYTYVKYVAVRGQVVSQHSFEALNHTKFVCNRFRDR